MNILRTLTLITLPLTMVGCFQMSDSAPGMTDTGSLVNQNEDDLALIDGTAVTSIMSSNHVLASMRSLTGVNPSAQTSNVFAAKKDIFAYEGEYNSINAPMMMSFTLVGAEICNDLVAAERALPAASRRFFGDINYAAGPNAITPGQIESLLQKMGVAYWGRNPTADEKMEMSSTLTTAFAGQTATAQTSLFSVFICTAMISAYSAVNF